MDGDDITHQSDAERIEAAAAVQRDATRRLSLEDRFRQNDSMSRFRVEAMRSRQRPGS